MNKILFVPVALFSVLVACTDSKDTPEIIDQDVDLHSLPWVDNQSRITVSFYDMNGKLIDNMEDVEFNNEYEVIFNSEKPVAMYVNKSFGFEFLSSVNRKMSISNIHRFKVLKKEPGFKKMVFEVYPMY